MEKNPKQIFHKVKDGSFEVKNTKYDFVVEQNMGQDPTLPGNVRLRIVKKKPIIKTIRTRYEPHIELDGDVGASLATFWGYDMKRLLGVIFISPTIIFMLAAVFTMTFWIPLLSRIVSVSVANIIGNIFLPFSFCFLCLFGIVPMGAHWYRNFKTYIYLKKHAVDYAAREEVLDEIAPKNF